jgi:hypothetical protein
VDRHRFNAGRDPDPTLHLVSVDPDSDPGLGAHFLKSRKC